MGGMQRPATDGASARPNDSWIEISSQPSSSSLSSAAPDDIVTTGMRVQHDSTLQQRQRPRNDRTARVQRNSHLTRTGSVSGSSQDEYEESESESDRVMSSSNEGLPGNDESPAAAHGSSSGASDEPVGDDDDGTTLGIASNQQCFTPQPNAFSHPPSSTTSRPGNAVPGSYFPTTRPEYQRSRSEAQRHSYPGYHDPSNGSHAPRNVLSPSYQADHDAALRASLSTLLSCAAARRAPKPNTEQDGKASSAAATTTTTRPQNNRVDPSTLRMVPEFQILGESPEPSTPNEDSSRRGTSAQDKGKRKAAVRSSSKDRARAAKKLRAMQSVDESISPTLLTWVVSAGVLVLASALSFSAGYAVGKDAGRAEAAGLGAWSDDELIRSCGKEAARGGSGLGLRRTLRGVRA